MNRRRSLYNACRESRRAASPRNAIPTALNYVVPCELACLGGHAAIGLEISDDSTHQIYGSFGMKGNENRLTPGRVLALIGVALLVLVTNVAASVLYMVMYGHILDPGHEPKYYQDHIQIAGPYCSIVAGIPLMFLAGWWVAGWRRREIGYRGAFVVWITYSVIDFPYC